jgi:hypothetical protein
MRLIVAAVLAVLAVPAYAGGLCYRLRRWPATVIWRRLHAARLRGDGLSRAAPVSLLGIAPCGLDHPAAASHPPCLEEASLCGENAGLDREARLRRPGFASELICLPPTPIQNVSGLPQGLVRRLGGRVIARRSLRLFATKEVHHERAGRTAAAQSRHSGSRALFGPILSRDVSVALRPGLMLRPALELCATQSQETSPAPSLQAKRRLPAGS